MSDPRAIEAVTETLRNLVDIGVKEVEASAVAIARPPDRVGDTAFEKQVNLFLYQVAVDGALRNEPTGDLLPGETGDPPLPLVLHYLLTAHVADGDDLQAHGILGGALRILHEHARLTRAELAQIAPYSDIANQVERVRITWQPHDEKDIYSLWSVFQAPYRLSAAFEARVVLIDSRRRGRAPLPVLRRGELDRGPVALADAASPFPALRAAIAPNGQPAARLGDVVTLEGSHLSAADVRVRLTHPLLAEPVDVVAAEVVEVTDTRVRFRVPTEPALLPSGAWLTAVVHGDPTSRELPTNSVGVLLAPRITSTMPMTVARDAAGTAVVTLDCEPEARPGQSVALVLGGEPWPADPIVAPAGTLTFRVPDAQPGVHVVRLRIAGTDSLWFDPAATPPAPLASQQLTVT
ncbi:DUF4255 domain-containing protein [Actinoplanes sp. CA-051413]|uniref:DUF4255 domain-containing protein n=1 Tax=Actinoplanes sp. CA-051413 TaxID=3239899 RepID=UPI003D9592E2